MRVLAIIPARAGSKGIPRKNMRLMAGKPLIAHAIECALASRHIDDVVVTSDSAEVLGFAARYEGVVALDRDSELAQDAVTLDPVIYDATVRAEGELGVRYDVVVTLQPTSPLLRAATLDAALERFAGAGAAAGAGATGAGAAGGAAGATGAGAAGGAAGAGACDTLISVVNRPHLSWRRDEAGTIVPAYAKRLNRQELPPNYAETGAFLITRRTCMTPESRLGTRVDVFEVPEDEAVDIDTCQDWAAAEALLARKRIAFRADGSRELGLGHIYRALTLTYSLTGHDVVFLSDPAQELGANILREANMRVVDVSCDEDVLAWLDANPIDVFVNDTLDTSREFIRAVRERVRRVVTFEDMGEGALEADAVVNALYEQGYGDDPDARPAGAHSGCGRGVVYSGSRYVCLRDEFLTTRPASDVCDVSRVLVTFGGTDPLDMTSRLYRIVQRMQLEEGAPAGGSPGDPASGSPGDPTPALTFDFVLGPGYDNDEIVTDEAASIEVHRDAVRMSDHMLAAQIAVSSQGRTTYELASLGVPTIVLAQNEREQLHTFAQMGNGFINLGLGSLVSDADIESALHWIIGATSVRSEMRRRMLACDLRSGIERVKRIILGDML